MTSDRTPQPCPYCNFVYYSKGALTTHINAEHWREKEEDDARPEPSEENQ